jgi:hypothetical protein
VKNITLSITDLQHRRIRVWAAQRNCSASFIVRRLLEDLPRIARALQAVIAYELDRMGIRPTPENQALVDLLKPVPRNKKSVQIRPAKQNIPKQLAQDEAVTLTSAETENTAVACGTVERITAPLSALTSCVQSTSHSNLIRPELHTAQNAAG